MTSNKYKQKVKMKFTVDIYITETSPPSKSKKSIITIMKADMLVNIVTKVILKFTI